MEKKNDGYRITFISFAVLVFVISVILVVKTVFPLNYADEIERTAKAEGVEPALVSAVILTESGFNPSALSRKGAVGLMQLMPATAEWCAKKKGVEFSSELLYSPSYNIELGVYYLKYLSQRFDDLSWVLIAYNAGEGNARLWREQSIPVPYKETRDYVKKVMLAYRVYKILYNS